MRDYAEIVKGLRNCAAINSNCTTCPMVDRTCCVMQLQANAADAIEELVAVVPKWISVEERLPEDRHSVLVYCPYNKCIYTAYWDGENWVHFGGGNIGYVSFPVTHWMPLPDPPKEVV